MNDIEVQVGRDWYDISQHPISGYGAWETFLRKSDSIFKSYRVYDAVWIEDKKWDILAALYSKTTNRIPKLSR